MLKDNKTPSRRPPPLTRKESKECSQPTDSAMPLNAWTTYYSCCGGAFKEQVLYEKLLPTLL